MRCFGVRCFDIGRFNAKRFSFGRFGSGCRFGRVFFARDADGETKRDLDFLLLEIARLDHSVEELLFHAGEPRYVMRDVRLADVAQESARILRPLAEHLGVSLKSEIAASARLQGDAAKLILLCRRYCQDSQLLYLQAFL